MTYTLRRAGISVIEISADHTSDVLRVVPGGMMYDFLSLVLDTHSAGEITFKTKDINDE